MDVHVVALENSFVVRFSPLQEAKNKSTIFLVTFKFNVETYISLDLAVWKLEQTWHQTRSLFVVPDAQMTSNVLKTSAKVHVLSKYSFP